MNGNISNLPMLAIIIPFTSAFLLGLFGSKRVKIHKAIAFFSTLISLIMVILLIKPILLKNEIISYWMGSWIPEKNWAIGIGLEVDGLGLFVGLIIAVTCFLSSIYSFRYMEKDNGLDKYYTLFLLLTASMLGFVFTGDLFNMYVMLEIMTFAAIALTSFRNNTYKAIEAGFKYIVIGSLGSSLILLGTVLLYAQVHTLNLAQIAAILHKQGYSTVSIFALALLLVGYAVKAFLVPCHTWPPDAHMSAPSSISMLLSGVMSKTGVYGIIRVLYMLYQSMGLPQVEFLIIFWGTITMFIGVTMALIQTDFKRLLAFHSVSQIGYIVTALGVGLALNSKVAVLGTMGGLYHMLNHATFKCLLFLCAGAVLYRTGTTDLNKLGGLSKKMPHTTILFMIGAASISGIPPFNGFVSKWLIYQSTYEAGYAPITIIALLVSVMTLASFVKVGQSVFFGRMPKEHKNVKEIPLSMRIPMGILAFICIFAGIFPKFISKYIIEPAAYSIYNIGKYVDVMFGKGYAAKMFGEIKIPELNYVYAGYWNPKAWLVLFLILLVGFMLVLTINIRRTNKTTVDAVEQLDSKYETFTGGEKEEFTHVAGHDLFWGLKHELSGYFKVIHEAHSGIVNDYVLWVVGCLCIVTIYLFVLMP
ncbi:proton-conducting transporter membrane subunit [Haloimpatiens sp. FM7330]|uniref:proton-conducting transporter transmembrane domain-containing protein n=1 Tax=Haloimpatiens sp. FM7330 TaxID=3298610 RepID=UPI0036436890